MTDPYSISTPEQSWVSSGTGRIVIDTDGNHIALAKTPKYAKLIAAAPDMARYMIVNEYTNGGCAGCGYWRDGYGKLGSENYYAPGEHHPACPWLAIMKKIGSK